MKLEIYISPISSPFGGIFLATLIAIFFTISSCTLFSDSPSEDSIQLQRTGVLVANVFIPNDCFSSDQPAIDYDDSGFVNYTLIRFNIRIQERKGFYTAEELPIFKLKNVSKEPKLLGLGDSPKYTNFSDWTSTSGDDLFHQLALSFDYRQTQNEEWQFLSNRAYVTVPGEEIELKVWPPVQNRLEFFGKIGVSLSTEQIDEINSYFESFMRSSRKAAIEIKC